MDFSLAATKNIDEILKELETSENGISKIEAKKRLEFFGLNKIKEEKQSKFKIFLLQFKSPFTYLLLLAALISFLIGEKIDGIMILAFVLINATLSFYQTYKAEKIISILKKYFNFKVKVKRDGKEIYIEEEELVPGDIVFLESGNLVPADIRITEAKKLLVDESILTGESVLIQKDPKTLSETINEPYLAKNILFTGTSIVSGVCQGVVISTGPETFFGKTAQLTLGLKKESIYEKDIMKFANLILKTVAISILSIFLIKIIIQGKENILDFLLFCVALIVGILPEALPLVITFTFSKGALKLAKERVVVKRLSAVEDLGNIQILCTDKTGTLTENKMSLANIISQDPEKCLKYAIFSSGYFTKKEKTSQGQFDDILWEIGKEKAREEIKKVKFISEIPFDSFRMRNSVLIEDESKKRVLIVKGAPEIILKLSLNSDENIKEKITKEEKEGKRTLALAFKEIDKDEISVEDENNLNFLGFFSFYDPLKKTAKEAINLAKKLGVEVKILTGDSIEIATLIAKEISLIKNENSVISGEDLEKMSEEDFKKACQEYLVFARVSPILKYKIVKTLQENYEVGFLGEGVNDAPALKAAGVGIVVNSAADISKEAADLILLKKDLKVLIEGIQEGRNIFANVNKYIKYALSSNFGNFYSMALISLFIPYLPMLPTQILLENLFSDFPAITIATDKVDIDELKRPRAYQLKDYIPLILILAIVSSIFDFIFFAVFRKSDPSLLRTLWFIESLLTEIALIFSIRTHYYFLKGKAPDFSLSLASISVVFLTLFLPYTNLGKELFHFVEPGFKNLIIIIFLVINYLIISEIVKLNYFKKKINFKNK